MSRNSAVGHYTILNWDFFGVTGLNTQNKNSAQEKILRFKSSQWNESRDAKTVIGNKQT